MKKISKKLDDFEKSSPLSIFYDFGLEPNDIKGSIIESFSDYFENKENLESNAVSDLVNNWLAYLTVNRDFPDSITYISSILKICNDAKKVNESEAINSYINWYPQISQSISRFWSINNNQFAPKETSDEDFFEESLKMIGQTIEGLSKPFLKLLLQLNRIKRKKPYDFVDLQNKDLGVVIDELINTSDLNELLVFNSIRLNQWRNIAYHHNSKIVNEKLICWYKKDNQNIEISLDRTDVHNLLDKIVLTFKLLRISETIFCFDNIQKIQQASDFVNDDNINIRQESKLLDLYSTIGSQGFKVLDITFNKSEAYLKLKDLQDYSYFQKRAIHSTQFLYHLWLFSGSTKLVVEYNLYDGQKYLAAEIESSIFSDLKEDKKLSDLLTNIKFTYITTKFTQNKDPFKNIRLTKALRDSKSQFLSQLGEEISLKEFIKQFTLSVFNNYLVFKSEEFLDSEIKMNIGSDGAMVNTLSVRGNFLFSSPAVIKNKSLQKELIKLLNNTIDLFNEKELDFNLVEMARLNNRYYFKKSLIKDQLKNNALENEFDFKLIKKVELQDDERKIFAALLKKQGKVRGDLNLKADRCKLICIVYKDETPVAIGGIKQKTTSDFYKEKANLPDLEKKFDWELGYIYTTPEYTRKGIAKTIVKTLMENYGDNNIMASTEINDNPGMVKILKTYGFEHSGAIWQSNIHFKNLGLFLRYKS